MGLLCHKSAIKDREKFSFTVLNTSLMIIFSTLMLPNRCQSKECNSKILSSHYHLTKLTDHQKFVLRLAENGHTNLQCTEGEYGYDVQWYKNNKLLNASFRFNMAKELKEPHLTIDPFNTLFIMRASKTEEGIYICLLSGLKMREYLVKVVSMDKIINQDFIRYSLYLGFILSFTATCYCAGLCVAWHRRGSFADPLNLQYSCK